MFTVYSSVDKINFEFEEQHKTLPEAINCVGKWLAIRAIRIDPNISKEEKWPKETKEHWFIFEGKNNIEGKLVGSTFIHVKRLK